MGGRLSVTSSLKAMAPSKLESDQGLSTNGPGAQASPRAIDLSLGRPDGAISDRVCSQAASTQCPRHVEELLKGRTRRVRLVGCAAASEASPGTKRKAQAP